MRERFHSLKAFALSQSAVKAVSAEVKAIENEAVGARRRGGLEASGISGVIPRRKCAIFRKQCELARYWGGIGKTEKWNSHKLFHCYRLPVLIDLPEL